MAKKFLALWLFICVVVFVGLLVIAFWLGHRKAADITADFTNHSSTIAIPANFFGSGGVGSTVSAQSGIDNITNVSLLGNRLWLSLHLIYPTGNIHAPDYHLYDAQLQRGTQKGLDPLITIYGTPHNLGVTECEVPSDLGKWAKMVAAAVHHTNQLHPGLWYELWNEPDFTICNSSNALNDYLRMYAALGPLFRAACPTCKLGGPSLASSGNTSAWMPALLNGATAPYVDFASFHIYITGTWLLPDMTWQEAYDQTQSETGGVAYYYRLFEQTVRAGHQPDAAHTPIVLTEYNTNYAFEPNNVQNDPVFGPLWNTVVVADFMNVVAQGSFPPSRIHYFAAGDSRNYFCLEAIPNGDPKLCAPPTEGQPYDAVYAPYPTLKAYELFCSPKYLNLESGFSVVNPPAAPSGLLTLAVYTPTADSLVVINPTAAAISGLRVKLAHLGFRASHGQAFTLANNALTAADVKVGGGKEVTATVDVPAYSTVAVTVGP